MANIPGTVVGDPLTIGDTLANKFGSHYSFMGIGGSVEVLDLEELYAIPVKAEEGLLNTGDALSSGRRRMGMTVFVYAENKYLKLYDPLWISYSTDLQKYNSLKNNNNWRDAFSGLFLPIAGGTLTGKLGLPNGDAGQPSLFFSESPITGIFNDNSRGLGISSKGKRVYFTAAGIETFGENSFTIGEGSSSPGNFAYAFGGYVKATTFASTAIGCFNEAAGTYSTVIGSSSKAFGNQTTAVGILSTVAGFQSTVLGSNLYNDGDYSTLVGVSSDCNSSYSTLIGAHLFAPHWSNYSTLLGAFLFSYSSRGVVIGSGINRENRLQNNIGNSIFLGSNSTVPSLFIGGGNGSPGSLGNVGVNLTNPVARLDLLEGNPDVAPFRIRKNELDKEFLQEGEFQFSAGGRLEFSPGQGTIEQFAYLSDLGQSSSPFLFSQGRIGYSPEEGVIEQLAYLSDLGQSSSPFIFTGTSGNGIKSSVATNKASGEYSFATGYASLAMSLGAVAVGIGSKAWGSNTFVAGDGSIATGYTSSAIGGNVKAFGDYSHAEGNNTITGHLSKNFSVSGSRIIVGGDVTQQFHNGATLLFYSIIGGSTEVIQSSINNSSYDGSVTTFDAGFDLSEVTSGYCVNPSFGRYGHAEGMSTTVIGQAGHAEGNGTKAIGDYSHAEGQLSTSNGNTSHAEGYNSKANGDYSHAEGSNTISSASYAHSEGVYTIASGTGSHAQGVYSKASGDFAHAEGNGTVSSGVCSHSEGLYSEAISSYSYAGGADSKAERTGQFSRSSGKFSVLGDAQYSRVCMRRQTTNATITELFVDGASERLSIPSGKVWSYTIDVVAKQTGGTTGVAGTCASFLNRGLIKNIGGVVTLIDQALVMNQREAAAAGWVLTISANDLNDALRIQVTGEANKTIRWMALVQLTEVS